MAHMGTLPRSGHAHTFPARTSSRWWIPIRERQPVRGEVTQCENRAKWRPSHAFRSAFHVHLYGIKLWASGSGAAEWVSATL